MIILVMLELNPDRLLPEARRVIKKHADYYQKVFRHAWLVDTAEDVDTWSRRMLRVTNRNDGVLVIRVSNEYDGRFTKETWEWLNISRDNGDFD